MTSYHFGEMVYFQKMLLFFGKGFCFREMIFQTMLFISLYSKLNLNNFMLKTLFLFISLFLFARTFISLLS
jgi:hypothetical protein